MNLKNMLRPALVIILCLLIVPFMSFGQDDPDNPGGDPDEPFDIPIDGGASVLVSAAALYGIKRLRQRGNENLNK